MSYRLLFAAVLLSAGCGRLGFGAASDPDGGAGDGGLDARADARPLGPGVVLALDFEEFPVSDRVTGEVGACTTCPAPTPGRSGGSAGAFNGASCLSFADRPALRPAAFTLALWVRTSTTIEQTPITKPSDSIAATSNTWEMVISNLAVSYTSYSGQYEGWLTPVTLPSGTWHHLAFTYGAGTKRIYLDGAEAGMQAGNPFTFGTDPVLVGCDLNGAVLDAFFSGSIDDVLIYDRELASVEIAALAQ